MIPRLKCLAAIVPLLFVSPLYAEEDPGTVVVTATRQPMRTSELLSDVTVIDREEIERSGQETIADVLAKQPGIQISRNGGPGTSTSLFIRGANSNQTKVLVDGIPINSAYDLSGSPLHLIPLDNVERIEVLRGPAAGLYGADTIGGVIHIITKQGAPGLRGDAFVGLGTQDTRQVNAGLSGGNEQWRFRLEGSHYYTGGISAINNTKNRDADKDPYRNNGGAFSLSFLPVKGHELGMSYRRNQGLSHYDSGVPDPVWGGGDSPYPYRNYFETEQWRVFSKNRLTDYWQSTIQYSQAEESYENYSASEVTKNDARNKQLSWQNDIKLPLGTALLAVERLEQQAGPQNTYRSSPEITNNSFLVGWSANHNNHRWQLNTRYDDHSKFGGENTYGIAYGYQITDEWRAHASYGTAFKAPSVYQLYMYTPASWGYGPYYGNPDLKPEKSRNKEIALIWDKGTHTASLTVYQNNIRDMIEWVTLNPATYEGTYGNVDRARLQGATLSYAGQIDTWRIQASYDWLDAKDRNRDLRLGRRARDSATFSVSKLWGAWEPGVELVYAGSRPDRTVVNSATLASYTLVNLTANYKINKDFSVTARLNNVFDENYELAKGYGTQGFNAFIGLRYSPK